jgi:hypothetical protein
MIRSLFVFILISFSNGVSQNCSIALINLFETSTDGSCSIELSSVLSNSDNFNECVRSINEVNCMNPYSVSQYSSDQYILHPWVLQAQSPCLLCDPMEALDSVCSANLESSLQIISGKDFDSSLYSSPYIGALVAAVKASCSSPDDYLSLSVLRYQSNVVCASSSSFGKDISPANTLLDVMDMRYLTQCGLCGVQPCTPGMLCAVNKLPELCPAGYYCPDTTSQIICPSGYYCPLASYYPIECQGLSAGTCPEGSKREVVWIPMLWTFASLIALFAVTTVGPRWLMDRIGYLRQLYGSKKSVDPPAMNGVQLGGIMSPTRVAIDFENIELVTNGTRRLNGISGSIRPGSFTAIMGASGCG